MWIWLILSMVLVIACIIFGIHSFLSSRNLQRSFSPEIKHKKNRVHPQYIETGIPVQQQYDVSNFKFKLKSIEENSVLQTHQLNDILKRIETLEKEKSDKEERKWSDDDEDWEKLYYEARKEKELLAENLELTNHTLDETRKKLEELEKQKSALIETQSNAESRLDEVYSLQTRIDKLQQELDGANERERDLAKQIADEKFMHAEHELLQKQNNQLRNEAQELRNRLEEINAQNIIMEQKLKRLTELESSLEISEYEKLEIKNSVEQIIVENMTLSEKLQELQHRLIEERKFG